jgi:hypothetical protein
VAKWIIPLTGGNCNSYYGTFTIFCLRCPGSALSFLSALVDNFRSAFLLSSYPINVINRLVPAQ